METGERWNLGIFAIAMFAMRDSRGFHELVETKQPHTQAPLSYYI